MKLSFVIVLFFALHPLNCLNAQMSSRSQVHTPNTYTPSVDLSLLQNRINSGQQDPVNRTGVAVKRLYSQYSKFPSLLSLGSHKVYVIGGPDDGAPTECYDAIAVVIKNENGKQFISKLYVAQQEVNFGFSKEINNCLSQVLWECGTYSNGNTMYCGYDIYFLDDVQQYNINNNASSSSTGQQSGKYSNGSLNTPIYNNEEFYDGYQLLDFAKKVGFKPKNYNYSEWEYTVVHVFSSGSTGAANSRQLNIDAMYLCDRQSDVMYRRYIGLYSYVSESTFSRYCRLFLMLLKTDELRR
jgi:hypothetical protein